MKSLAGFSIQELADELMQRTGVTTFEVAEGEELVIETENDGEVIGTATADIKILMIGDAYE